MKQISYSGTGSHDNTSPFKEVKYPFGEFEITIKLGEENQFVAITEVKIRKEFYGFQSFSTKPNSPNVDGFYKE